MKPADWLRILALSVLWGGTYMLASIALKGWPPETGGGVTPLTLVFLRVALAALALAAVCRFVGEGLPRGIVAWRAFFGMGLLNNVIPFSLIFWGQSQMPASVAAGLASILNATTPLFTVLVAHVLTSDERATPLKIVGVLAGLAGVAMMVGADAVGGLGVGATGQIACLLAALTYAFSSIYGRRFKRMAISPLQTALGQLTASSLMMAPVVLIFDQPWNAAPPGTAALLAVLAMAIFSTALAYILFFQILSSAGATNLTLVTFLIPASAIFLGAIVLGEALHPHHLLGLAFIGCGLAAIDGRLFRRGRP
ncbi:MAG: DMT family transporter [Beijerinckiaceae bacterium]